MPLSHGVLTFLLFLLILTFSYFDCLKRNMPLQEVMAANDPHVNLQNCHYQEQSPLFGLLPGEIRNKIFAYSLVQFEDDAAAYPENSYWYRPGFKGPKKSSSSLLQTCKLAYTEGQRVFLEELEWAFWFGTLPPVLPRGRSSWES